jgi:hypothetical protein
VATFDIIPLMDEIDDLMFSFVYSNLDEIDNSGFQQVGFESRNFIYNTGSMFLFAVYFFIWRLAARVVKYLA